MSRKKKVTVIEDVGEGAQDQPLSPVEMAEAEEQAEKELQEKMQSDVWLSEFKARFTDQPAKILVERFDEEGEWAICRKYPLSSFDPDALRIEYGGGKYRCTLFDPGGKWVKDGRTYFKFADPINKGIPAHKQENPLEIPMVSMMIEAQKQNSNMLMGVLQSIIASQGTAGGAAKPAGLGEIVEVVKSLNSMAPKDKPFDNFKEFLGLQKLLRDATGDSDGDGKGGIMSDIKDLLEVLPMIKENLAKNAAIAAPLPAAPIPGTVTVNPQPSKDNMDPLTKKVVELVPKFVGGARSNGAIGEWGNFLLDAFDVEVLPLLLPMMQAKYKPFVKTEDDVYDFVLKLAQDPDERAAALKQIPPFAPYLPWVNQVIDEAIRLSEVEPPAEAPANVVLDAIRPTDAPAQ